MLCFFKTSFKLQIRNVDQIDRLLEENTAVDIKPQNTLLMVFDSLQYVSNYLDRVPFIFHVAHTNVPFLGD